MNKFIKAKADLIDSLITKTIIHGSGLYRWIDWDLNTNRGANRMLRQLRKLPAEFWIHNHPELVTLQKLALLTGANYDASKLAINQRQGASRTDFDGASAAIVNSIDRHLEARRESKNKTADARQNFERACYNLLVYLCGKPEYRTIRTDWKIQFFRKD